MLAAEGLVELLPNRGAIALQLTEADVLNTFEVMAGLEGQSGRAGGHAHYRRRTRRNPRHAFRNDGLPTRGAICQATTA
jgi:DNA-binding GntR family transcriptional regulator